LKTESSAKREEASIVRTVKCRRTDHAARRSEREKCIQILMATWECNIKTDLRKIGGGRNWFLRIIPNGQLLYYRC
jgi:hypothetical protein